MHNYTAIHIRVKGQLSCIVLVSTYLSLNHVVPLLPHLKDKIEGVDHPFLLSSLQLYIHSNESASTTHSSTISRNVSVQL